MNPEALLTLLKVTYHSEVKEARVAAEAELKKLEAKPGFVATLLKIVTVPQIDAQGRQSASIMLKNMVTQYWTITEGKLAKISPQDRKVIKDNLLEAIICQPLQIIRVQLLECLFKICRMDWPEQWPELVPAIMKNLGTNDKNRVYGAICALRMIFKKYQYKQKRDEMNKLVDMFFPIELKLFQSVVRDMGKGNPLESFEMMRIIIKTFFMAISLALPPYVKEPATLTAWLNLLMGAFTTPLPKEHIPADPALLKQHPFMKCKKWCGVIFNRLFARFGHPNAVEKEDLEFSKYFYANWAEKLMGCSMQMLKYNAEGGAVTPRVLQLSLNYITICVNYSALYKNMKPHLEFLLLKCVLPTLCLNKEDLELWQKDAIEFVRRESDINVEFFDPKIAAQNLLIELVKIRTRDCLTLVLGAVGQIFNTYAAASPEKRNPVIKEGAMRMFGCLKKLLGQRAEFGEKIENILVNHIFPEFKSPNGFMRARSNWLVGMYCKLQYRHEQNYGFAIKAVTTSLADKEIPVKLAAAVALSKLVRGEKAVAFLKPHIPEIINQFFGLVDAIGNEEVVVTLGNLIQILGDDVAPFAAKIVTKMVAMFMQLSQADEDDDLAGITAQQCLATINLILYALEDRVDMYAPLERLCQPILEKMICFDGIEFYEDVLEMVTCFTWYPNEPSPFIWTLLPKIIAAFNDWAGDYIANMVPPIDNFISKGTDRFLATKNPNLLHGVLGICKRLYDEKEEEREMDCQHAAKILETLVAHCSGKIDNYIPDIIQMVGKKILECKTLPLKLLSIDVLAACAHYNPLLFCHIFHKLGKDFTTNIFNQWLSHINILKGSHKHQKMSVLGLASLTRVPIKQLPHLLGQSFGHVLAAIQELLANIKADEEKRDEEPSDEDDDSEEEPEDFKDIAEGEDAVNEIGSIKAWSEKVERALREEEGEGASVISMPYDKLDEYIFAAECLQALSRNEPAANAQWTKSLNAQQRATLESNISIAKQRKEEQAKKLAEGKAGEKKKAKR